MLSLQQFSVFRHHQPVVGPLSCQLQPGQVYHLLGANGSGKSSLLAGIAGLLSSTGDCLLGEQSLLHRPPIEQARYRALLLQQAPIRSHSLVGDYVRLGRFAQTFKRTHFAAQDPDFITIVDVLELAPLLPRRLHQLSGGERQRVEIARVLWQVLASTEQHAAPHLLMLDEPLTGLDFPHQLQLLAALRTFSQRQLIILMSHHDLNIATDWADEVLLMKQGQLLTQGPVASALTPAFIRQTFDFEVKFIVAEGRRILVPIAPNA